MDSKLKGSTDIMETNELKERRKARQKLHYAANREQVLARQKAKREQNLEISRQRERERRKARKEAGVIRVYSDKAVNQRRSNARKRLANRSQEEIARDKQYQKEWNQNNKVRRKLERRKRHANRTPEQKAEDNRKARESRRERRRSNIGFRIGIALRDRLRQALGDKLRHKWNTTFALLDCSIDALICHLESLWQEGMSWGNYGKWELGEPMRWHIDHIRPCASFDLTDPDQQNKCFHWSNLQPLWAVDNLSKGDRFDAKPTISLDDSRSNSIGHIAIPRHGQPAR